MAKDQDGWQKTFYQRAIQTSIGSALRSQYDLSQPLPDRLTRLLEELDDLDHAVDGDDTASAPGRAGLNRPRGRL